MFRRFNREFAYGYQTSGNWHGWHEDRFGPRWSNTFERRSGRGFPFGSEGRSSRFFGRGDVKFALLELLQERPMHGYEMMKALEEKSNGLYVPSAGTIYPTLQLLQDRGFVTVSEAEGKKVYHITEAGQSALKDRQKGEAEEAEFDEMRGFGRGRGRHHHAPEFQSLKNELKETVPMLMQAARVAFHDPAKMEQLSNLVKKLRQDIASIAYGEQTSSSNQPTPVSEEQASSDQAKPEGTLTQE